MNNLEIECIDRDPLILIGCRNDIKTITYECDDGFFIDEVEHTVDNYYEYFIYNKDYGIKVLLFGSFEKENIKDVVAFAEVNSFIEDYLY